ncbi:MAG: hypothetical protein ACI3YI_13205 [Bacteroidaceae bacterium]
MKKNQIIKRVLEDGFRTSLNPDDLFVAWGFIDFKDEIKELMICHNKNFTKAIKNVDDFLHNFLNS